MSEPAPEGEQTMGSATDLAIQRALEAANLRAGDSLDTSASVLEHWEPSAVEAGDIAAGAGAD